MNIRRSFMAIPALQSAWCVFLRAIESAVIGKTDPTGAAPISTLELCGGRTAIADALTRHGGRLKRFWSTVRRNRLERDMRAGLGSMD
jgi:hypothetical protein